MSADDNSANAKSRADELQHLAEVERSLHELKKLHPTWKFAGLADNPPEYIQQIRERTQERELCFTTLERLGVSRPDLARFSEDLRKRGDDKIGQLHQLAGTQAIAEPNPNAASQPTAAPPLEELTDREKKIWEVIQRGVTGPLYCREVHNAGIRPLKSGIWKDCPAGTYPAAYQLGEPWPHRIQDEKSKIRRKALALLAASKNLDLQESQ